MHHVKAHVAGACDAHDGVEIRSVVVAQAARFVDDARDLKDVAVKKANRVRVREHKARRVGADGGFERFEIDAAVWAGGDVHDREARHCGARGVRAVGGVRDDDLRAGRILAVAVVGLDEQKSCEFAVRAGSGLESKAVHTRDRAEELFGNAQDVEAALDRVGRLQGVDVRKAREGGEVLVDSGVVFHRAGAERVKAFAHAVGPAGKSFVVAVDFDLRELWQRGRGRAQVRLRRELRDVAGREVAAAAAFAAFFKEQFHLTAPPLRLRPARRSRPSCSFRSRTRGSCCRRAAGRRGNLFLRARRGSFRCSGSM